MFSSFEEIRQQVLDSGQVKRIALACAHDEPALSAVVEARRAGIATAALVGKAEDIRSILASLDEDVDGYEVINESDERAAAQRAVALVRSGAADIVMKGLMQTATYMRAILDKEHGLLPSGGLLSQTTVFEYADQHRLVCITDCGINIRPDVAAKIKIIENAVALDRCLGVECPRVACLSAVENVNPKIESTVDANTLARMEWSDCVVEGPFALDNAISPEAAAHKSITGAVAGRADILLVPELTVGNVLHKSINFFAHYELAGAVCGTSAPVILTSRTDSAETKFNSVLLAVLQASARA